MHLHKVNPSPPPASLTSTKCFNVTYHPSIYSHPKLPQTLNFSRAICALSIGVDRLNNFTHFPPQTSNPSKRAPASVEWLFEKAKICWNVHIFAPLLWTVKPHPWLLCLGPVAYSQTENADYFRGERPIGALAYRLDRDGRLGRGCWDLNK